MTRLIVLLIFVDFVWVFAAPATPELRNAPRGSLWCRANQIEYHLQDADVMRLVVMSDTYPIRSLTVESVQIGPHNTTDCLANRFPKYSAQQIASRIVVSYGRCGFQIGYPLGAEITTFSSYALITVSYGSTTEMNRFKHFRVPLSCSGMLSYRVSARREVLSPAWSAPELSPRVPAAVVLDPYPNKNSDQMIQRRYRRSSFASSQMASSRPDATEEITLGETAEFFDLIVSGTVREEFRDHFGYNLNVKVHLFALELDSAAADTFEMLGRRCWATPDERLDGPLRFDFITSQGYNNIGEDFLNIKRTGGHKIVYEIADFEFVIFPDIQFYSFHCEVNICLKNTNDSRCIAG